MSMLAAIPDVFRSAKEYAGDTSALELAQATFNEEALYGALQGYAQEWFRRASRAAAVLDLCSASGLSSYWIARAIPVLSVDFVDVDAASLRAAAARMNGTAPVRTHIRDAAVFASTDRFDLVLANSAYHHIEDDRKRDFLKRASDALAPGGSILVGEHFLPPYDDAVEYQRAVLDFYEALVAELLRRNEPEDAIAVIRRSGLYCWQGFYEYKVCWNHFLQDVSDAGLRIATRRLLWAPPGTYSDYVGSIAVELDPA